MQIKRPRSRIGGAFVALAAVSALGFLLLWSVYRSAYVSGVRHLVAPVLQLLPNVAS